MGSLRRRKSSERDTGASGSSSITRHESLMVPMSQQQQSPRLSAGPQRIGSLPHHSPTGGGTLGNGSRAVTSRVDTGLKKPTKTLAAPSAAPVSFARNSTGSSGAIPPTYTNSFQAKSQREKSNF